jgi:nicotinamidase-related amidase
MLKTENALLIIIDIQGKLAEVVNESEKHNAAAMKMIAGAQALELPILLTAQAPHKIGHTTEQVRELLPDQHEFARMGFSIYTSPEIVDALKASGRKQMILCGFESHICIYQSALDLMNAGYEVYILVDAVSSRDPQNKSYILQELRAEGAHLVNVETVFYAMMRDPNHPAFKQLSKLVR